MTTTKNTDIFKDHPKVKNLGIWMDHTNAHLTEFITDPITTEIISNKTAHREKELSPVKNEDGMHHQHAEYYQKLCNIIRNFQDVLLFGPTGAKLELLHLLRSDHQFEHIKLDIKESDKMSQNKQHDFVRDHFSHR